MTDEELDDMVRRAVAALERMAVAQEQQVKAYVAMLRGYAAGLKEKGETDGKSKT